MESNFSSCTFSLRIFAATWMLVAFSTTGMLAKSDSSGGESETVGVPWTGAKGVRELTSDIMAREAERARKGERPYRIHQRPTRVERQGIELVEYASEQVPTSPATETSGPIPASSLNAQGVAFSFLGATLGDTHAYPPDSMGAVGPTQFIVAVNGRIRSFNKTTGVADGVINADSDVFFSSVMTPVAVNFTSDPRIRYDRLSRRWFVIMIDVPNGTGATPDRIMIAASDGPIITGSSSWTFFYFQHDLPGSNDDAGKFADYPTLGIDANALYIGVNIFGTRGTGTFDNTTAFVVRKSTLLVTNNAPTNIVVTAFRSLIPKGNNPGPYTPQGVDNYDPAATEGYVIGVARSANFAYFDQLILRRITNPGGTPSISGNITVSLPVQYGFSMNVPHLGNTGGTAGNLDGLDERLMMAHLRNGRLWTCQNVAVDNTGSTSGTDSRVGVRWYELQGIATGQTPGVVQSGTLFQPSAGNTADQRCYWMGSIMVSGQGHAALGFSVAGAAEHANAGTAGRLAKDAAGTLRTPILYTASSTAYNPRDANNNPINRWGDYSYTCLDPNDDMTMWTIQEFCNATDSYGVQVAKLLAPAPATPAGCSPPSASTGTTNLSVVVFGLSDGDTGFFDPGAGFSNRISAAVNGGGVTVNSITYNNPTNLTLNINVSSGAAIGARTITVTNPDGQAATSSSGILTITAGTATNSAPTLTAISNQSVNEGSALVFTNTAADPNGDTLSYSLDPGAPTNATINATTGVFSWTPTEAQGPATNSITVRVTDNGTPALSDAKTFQVVVDEVNQAPVLAAIANRTVHAGMIVSFTNSATDADIPANTLSFSLDPGAPAGAVVGAGTGIFSWNTGDGDAGTTNNFTVRVTDNGVPPLDDAKLFDVVVVSRPVVQVTDLSGNAITITWTAISGQSYRVQYKTNLTATGWTDLLPDVTAVGPTASKSDSIAPAAQKFYRVRVLP